MTPPLPAQLNGKTDSAPDRRSGGRRFDRLRGKLTARPRRWPALVPLLPAPPPPAPCADEIVATWIGHSTFRLQTALGNILTDPVFSDRASPRQWAGRAACIRPASPSLRSRPSTSCCSATITTTMATNPPCAASPPNPLPSSSPRAALGPCSPAAAPVALSNWTGGSRTSSRPRSPSPSRPPATGAIDSALRVITASGAGFPSRSARPPTDSGLPVTPATTKSCFAPSGTAPAPPTSRSCPSAPTNRAGSWPRCT